MEIEKNGLTTFAWCKEIVPKGGTAFLRLEMTTRGRKYSSTTLFNITQLSEWNGQVKLGLHGPALT